MSRVSAIYSVLSDLTGRDVTGDPVTSWWNPRSPSDVTGVSSILSDLTGRDPTGRRKSQVVAAKPKATSTAATTEATASVVGVVERRSRRSSSSRQVDRVSVKSADCVLLLDSSSDRRRHHSIVSFVKPQKVSLQLLHISTYDQGLNWGNPERSLHPHLRFEIPCH